MTLNDILVRATRQMGMLDFVTSTAGDSTSVNAATLRSNTADDQFNNGTLFILTSTGSATSIDGQFRQITDYVASSGQFHWATSLAANTSAGCAFAYTGPEFRTELLVELANDALRALGPLTFIDRTTVSSANQTAYAAAVAWKYSPPLQIDVMYGVGTSAAKPDWRPVEGWHYQPATAGNTGLIVFDGQLPVTRDIRVWYLDHHARVTLSTAAIDERIHPDLAVAAMIEKMYEFRNSRSRGGEPFDVQRWTDAKLRLEQERVRYPIWKPKRKPKILALGGDEGDHLPFPAPYGPG